MILLMRKIMVVLVIFTFTFAGVTPAICGSRIMPTGAVKVYDGQMLVQVLKKESPLPVGGLLTTEGKCGVRMENIYLVAEDGAVFGIVDGPNRIDLRVDKGVVYFAINDETGKLVFLTPAGVISTQQVQLNVAAAGGLLKGFVDVSGPQVHLGVLEGGSMVVSTVNGEKNLASGKQIILAMADPIDKAKEKDVEKPAGKSDDMTVNEDSDDEIPTAYFIGGGIGVLGAAGWAYANATTSNTSTAASPAAP